MKIWLDDERHIPKEGDGWIRFYTAPEVITYMSVPAHWESVEEISLDYYLGMSNEVGCGQDVMNWLKERVFSGKITKLPVIGFHTSSRSAYRMMERTLFQMWDHLNDD